MGCWKLQTDLEKTVIEFSEVESIVELSEDETYDIWNYDENCQNNDGGNFIIDDVIVHNSIPEAMANRDSSAWRSKLHPQILEILEDTYGVIVYQEQLQAIWQRVAGFTAPEAQEARKAVAKKWTHKLKPIRDKWLAGATKALGATEAAEWWNRMESFGRYAFNKSHSVSYCLMAFRCLWLKAHFAPEFWAAVMSDCHPDKLVRYMSVARAEDWQPTDITYSGTYKPSNRANGVQFGTININDMTKTYTVTGDVVNQGLIGIKGIGEKSADSFAGQGDWKDIDHFVSGDAVDGSTRKDKKTIERFIKLGAFAKLPGHENTHALWQWYQYKYCSGLTEMKNEIKGKLLEKQGWNNHTVAVERNRQIDEYRRQYPKRNKIPAKFGNWMPKPDDSRDNVMALFDEDYTQGEKLEFQKEFLGYYLDSPLDLFQIRGNGTIKNARSDGSEGDEATLEVMITDAVAATTKPKGNRQGSPYLKLIVTDGIQQAMIFMWSNELANQDPENLLPGVGVRLRVMYDKQRGTFTMCRGSNVIRLRTVEN